MAKDNEYSMIRGAQDHFQAKASWAEQSGGAGSFDDNLSQASNSWRVNLSQIRLIQWECPPRILINRSWGVVSGEDSTEIEAQNERELRVLEAIYPHPSAIPPNSASSVDSSIQDDQNTPVIPVIRIADGDSILDASVPATSNPNISQYMEASSSAGNGLPDIAAAAQAAFQL